MSNTPTPHNSAAPGDIAPVVLMPGDPLRAEYIAQNYLENPVCFNRVRNMLGFTGTYKGASVSVMGSGMGMPSIGIYSYELYHFYGVETIIRIGSCGALSDHARLRDLIFVMGACTNSRYASTFCLPGDFAPIADFNLLRKAVSIAEEKSLPFQVGNILSSDTFYGDDETANDKWKKMGVLGIEMESAALYLNAARAGKRALGIMTVSDHLYTGEALSAIERQTTFRDMMEVALETAVSQV